MPPVHPTTAKHTVYRLYKCLGDDKGKGEDKGGKQGCESRRERAHLRKTTRTASMSEPPLSMKIAPSTAVNRSPCTTKRQ